jgi:hypothetical protein
MKSVSRLWSRTLSIGLLITIVSFTASQTIAEPRLNAQRAAGEPHWEGKIFLQGEAKELKDATPILERAYRPLHIYGNMQRRHHYRDTVIPSRSDRTERRSAFFEAR